ncbi:hypothetical protein K0F82_12705 [Bacteroides ovatus]|jgi:hypothetical protein|uniref:hypothetical protein n=1 Tax=Bacteroides ovatus TaxID=28116 RepID=UPI0012306C5C|nr:hypothetical protein [Bacteroides ovatus]KAA3994694.1 hypothetical protein F3F40_15500 [Bacteroides ovatus]KAA3994890.1 hypothetical protein F3D58_14850 [Bacteroides ovatus]MCE8751795.1 hypothetical protein [Bacteroides ovatus]
MKTIEFYAGQDIDKAYQDLQINAPCCGEFNGKVLYSTETIDEIYTKVLGVTKLEYEERLRKEHEDYVIREFEFKTKIPQLIEDYRKRAIGIIPEEYLELWNEIVPIRLNDLYHGMELDCWLELVAVLNDTSKKQLERFEICRSLFFKQGHSGMSGSLVLAGLRRFHTLGEMLASYINDSIKA